MALKDMFSSTSKLSSMRVMSVTIAVTACIISLLAVALERSLAEAALLVGALLAGALGGKVGQAKYESHGKIEDIHEEIDDPYSAPAPISNSSGKNKK